MSNITGFSKGLYTSWFYHSPTRSLFDCGEGCASFLGNKVYAIENIYLSHGHLDHVGGVVSLLGIRQLGMGDRTKPLNIYYPADTREIENLIKYWKSLWYTPLSYELNWIPINARTVLPNGVESFQTYHCRSLSLGYKVVEARKKLKAKYAGQDIPALLRSNSVDRADLMENYAANTFVYTLDSTNRINPYDIMGADEWIADTTFINPADREGNTHGTLDEMVDIAVEAKVKKMYCAHLSPRYNRQEIEHAISKAQATVGKTLELIPVHFNGVQNF